MLNIREGVLDILNQNLQRYVAPQVTSADGQLTVMLINFVLSYLATEEADLPGKQAERHAALSPLLEELRLKTTDPGSSNSQPTDALGSAIVAALAEPGSVQATSAALQTALLHGAVSTDLQRQIARVEAHFVGALHRRFAARSSGQAYTQEGSPVGQRQLTRALLTGYLQRRLPEYPGIEATEVVEVGGGMAKKTYRLSVERGPPGWEALILRQDAIGGPTPLSVLDEVAVLRAVERHGLPVAHIEWVEPDPRYLDAPFTLNTRRAGTCARAEWKISRRDAPPPLEQLAAYTARLHRIQIADIDGLACPADPTAAIECFLDSIERRWHRDRLLADPLMQIGFDWLHRNVPQDVAQLVIVHADLSERNILLEGGLITTLLDWELWHVGDPGYDLAYTRPLIEQIGSWSRFLDVYHEHGGPAVDPAHEDYWYILSEFRNVAMLASGLRTFVDGRNRNLKIIAPVMHSYRHRLHEGMQRLLPLL